MSAALSPLKLDLFSEAREVMRGQGVGQRAMMGQGVDDWVLVLEGRILSNEVDHTCPRRFAGEQPRW